jgi:hypothetical protein
MEGKLIRALLTANPFHPFTLGMMGKTRIRIERPELAEVSDNGDVLRLHNEQGLSSVISIEHIASITFDAPPPTPDVVVES